MFYTGPGLIFATRDEAVVDAERRLVGLHDSYVRLGHRLAKARETVAALRGGAA